MRQKSPFDGDVFLGSPDENLSTSLTLLSHMQHREPKPMPSGLLDHLKKDTSQEANGIGRLIKQEALISDRPSFLENKSKQSGSQNRIQRETHLSALPEDFKLSGFQSATPLKQQLGVHQLLEASRTDERYPIPSPDLSDEAEEVPPNPQAFPDSGSEEFEDELNDFYNNRIEMEELVVYEAAFDRKGGDSELKITAIASFDPGVVLLATDRLEIYSYDIKLGKKQLLHCIDESAFSSNSDEIRSRTRERPFIENLLVYNPQTYILMVRGNLFKFDPNTKSVERLIPVRQAKEQLVLEGRF